MSEARPALGGRPIRARSQHDPIPTHTQDRRPLALAFATAGRADIAAAKRWIDKEFQPSTLSKEQQLKEMEWFINAAKPYRGMEINVLSETIPTHEYESKVLAKAFEEITGIKRSEEHTSELQSPCNLVCRL